MGEVLHNKGVLENFIKIQRKTPMLESQAPTLVFSCKFCEIFKQTFFTEHLQATASAFSNEVF